MSIDQLAGQITALLIPVLPYIIKGIKIGGKKAAEKFGDISADKTKDLVTKMWDLITKKGKISPELSMATEKLARAPRDENWHAIMAKELKSLLKTNPGLAKEISLLLQSELPQQTIFAKENINTKIDQTTNTSGKQKVKANGNRGLDIRQNIKK